MRRIDKKDIDILEEYFRQAKGILIVYIFGSQNRSSVTEDTRKPRDIDIAILFEHDVPLRELLTLRADITSLLKTGKIDVVSLNNSSPLLKYEVVTGSKVIYSKREDIVIDFEMMAISHFMDTSHLRKVQREYLLADYLT